MGLKATLVGEGDRYDYLSLCMPTVPWKKSSAKLNFYSKGKYSGLHCFALVVISK